MTEEKVKSITERSERFTMTREMLGCIISTTGKTGPFTNWHIDSKLVPDILQWIDGDWKRMRFLLNLIHEQGVNCGITMALGETKSLLRRSDGRYSMRVGDLVLVNEPLLPDEVKNEKD